MIRLDGESADDKLRTFSMFNHKIYILMTSVKSTCLVECVVQCWVKIESYQSGGGDRTGRASVCRCRVISSVKEIIPRGLVSLNLHNQFVLPSSSSSSFYALPALLLIKGTQTSFGCAVTRSSEVVITLISSQTCFKWHAKRAEIRCGKNDDDDENEHKSCRAGKRSLDRGDARKR